MRAKCIATLAALLVAAAQPSLVLAQEHPKATEHPKSTEHPKATEHPQNAEHPAAAGDIIAVASGAGKFATLMTALKAAGLVGMLQGEGPFTVFAPTDEAFAKLPAGTLEELLKPANKSKLAAILSHHVVNGKVMAADVKTMKAKTLSGEVISLKVDGGKVMVDGATVIKADIGATNGVIHIIDTVVMPTIASGKPKDHPGHD